MPDDILLHPNKHKQQIYVQEACQSTLQRDNMGKWGRPYKSLQSGE